LKATVNLHLGRYQVNAFMGGFPRDNGKIAAYFHHLRLEKSTEWAELFSGHASNYWTRRIYRQELGKNVNHLIKGAIFIPLMLGLAAPGIALTPKISAAPESASTDAESAAPTVSAAAEAVSAHAAAVSARVKDYRQSPDSGSWDAALREIRDFAQLPATSKMSQDALLKMIPPLADIGTKFVDFSGNRLWNFTRAPECQHVILQWQSVTPGVDEAVIVKGRRRIVRTSPTVAFRADLVRVTPGVHIKEARIVSSVTTTTVGKRVVRSESPRSLILVGCDKSSASYLRAFRAASGTWNETPEVFNGVPPYVLQNLSGKASFSGSDLVLAIGGTSTSDGGDPKTGAGTTSNGYRIVLKLIGGRYTLDGGKNGEDGAIAVTAQFASALQQNRPDLAKAWLADPKLASIPKYVGYFTKSMPALRIIPMASPGNGSVRFRLITSLKEDLIVDVGKIKTLPFAVKAVFVAPPDPLASKILSNLQSPDPVAALAGKDKDKDKDVDGDKDKDNKSKDKSKDGSSDKGSKDGSSNKSKDGSSNKGKDSSSNKSKDSSKNKDKSAGQ
jgi:hypothetical protein